MRPAKGSASVLNTKIETGSVSAILRSISSPLRLGLSEAGDGSARGRVRENIHDEIQKRFAADVGQRRSRQDGKNAPG